MIPDVSREKILKAINLFDLELRQTIPWRDWEYHGHRKYAIKYDGKLYPVKHIIHSATNLPKADFPGGAESNNFVVARGFEVIPLQKTKNDSIQESLAYILRNYDEISSRPFAKHEDLWAAFETAKRFLQSLPAFVNTPTLKVKWSAGLGNWSTVPWIAVLDERETESTRNGLYCVMVFREDLSGVYLGIGMGVEDLIKQVGLSNVEEVLSRDIAKVASAFSQLENYGFVLDSAVDLRATRTLGRGYEKAFVANKFYDALDIPDDESLAEDWEGLLAAYAGFLNNKTVDSSNRIEKFKKRFLERMGNFKTFPSADSASPYAIQERNYKDELAALYRQTVQERLRQPAGGDEGEEALIDDIYRLCAQQKLKSNAGKPQNLLQWRSVSLFKALDRSRKIRLAAALRKLVYGSGESPERLEVFNLEFKEILRELSVKYISSQSRSIPTFFLMLAHPDKDIFVKTTVFKDAMIELAEMKPFEKGMFNAKEYGRVLQFAERVKEQLAAWGWEPRDMVDVQSFIWAVMSENSEKADVEGDNTNYWLVGAWSGDDDVTDQFVEDGIWRNGYEDRYLDLVEEMKVGDRIAIKSTFTQNKNFPFENQGRTVS
ncbi:MAG: DUF3578 domain-containing protein, partial [Pirellulaceae bacterium]